MNALFDYGEFIICIAPVFLIMAAVFFALLWNAIPSQKEMEAKRAEKKQKDDEA